MNSWWCALLASAMEVKRRRTAKDMKQKKLLMISIDESLINFCYTQWFRDMKCMKEEIMHVVMGIRMELYRETNAINF